MDALVEKLASNADPLVLLLGVQLFLMFRYIGARMGRLELALYRLAEKSAQYHGATDTPTKLHRPSADHADTYGGTD